MFTFESFSILFRFIYIALIAKKLIITISKASWLTVDTEENKDCTCCRKKTLGKTTCWLKAPRVVFVPCCRLSPVIRWSNEVKLANAKFRLGRGSFSFLLYFKTHPISPEKRIATGERNYRPRRRVSIMREVRYFDPFLARRILSCFPTNEGNVTISFFHLSTTFRNAKMSYSYRRCVKEFKKISSMKKTQYLQKCN